MRHPARRARSSRHLLHAGLAGIALAMVPAQVFAQADLTTGQAIERLFEEQAVDPAWFIESFLAQVPAQEIARILAQIVDEAGAFQGVEGDGNNILVRFERAEMDTQILLDTEGRIAGLLFGPPVPTGGDVEMFVEGLAALPGEISVLVTADGETLAAHQPDLALGVGSAFKLAILAVLMEDIQGGARSWSDVVELDPSWRSLPTGILQDWPDGMPVTLATLASLMISISDNTATDALLDIVGRDRVEARSPGNAPILSTGEIFRLKAQGNAEILARYQAADETGRREILAELAALPLSTSLRPDPVLDVEWFYDGATLCGLLDETAEAPLFEINPGLANQDAWQAVAFKGGSEPGVINLSTRLVAEDGTTYCVVATWNDVSPLNEQQFYAPYAGILRVLSQR